MLSIAFIILTKDEERNLRFCLESLAAIGGEVYVIDCGSTDGTVATATQFGAKVLCHPWTNYASQMNWAIKNIQSDAEWLMRIDADEALTPDLARALVDRLPALPVQVSAARVRLRIHFLGRWIRHGGMYPVWLLRIWRRGAALCEERWMDEHMVVNGGSVLEIEADLIHDNRKDLVDWLSKHIGYAAREARDLRSAQSTAGGLSGQASRTRWLKEKVYARTPPFTRAWLYWAYRYFVRLGFLDGAEGFAYHFFQALWYRSLVDATMLEQEKQCRRDKSVVSQRL